MMFRGQFNFLSNFHRCTVRTSLGVFPTAEHAFVAAKSDPENPGHAAHVRDVLATPNPGDVKRIGRRCAIRKDWDDVKVGVMREIVAAKFGPDNPELAQKLLATSGPLVEENTWHDNYWGACLCRKCESAPKINRLGLLLEEIRESLRTPKETNQ